MPGQKGWAGLEPETPKPLSDLKLKQKRGGQPFPRLKWPGVGQSELAGGPKVRSAFFSDFLADKFPSIF
jgi:hypothetical protein